METLNNIEYGSNKKLLYSLTLNITHPETGVELQLSDLYIVMHVKEKISDDALFSVIGSLNAETDKFEFTMTQEQANLMTVGKWYIGMEIKLTDADGIVLDRKTYIRKVEATGAKS